MIGKFDEKCVIKVICCRDSCDQRRLTESEIADMTLEELRLARNEIYARHGYIFNSEDLNSYFQQKSWYHEDAAYDGITLSEIEKYNVELIQNSERNLQ